MQTLLLAITNYLMQTLSESDTVPFNLQYREIHYINL